jgi:hypothetical protein
MDYSNSYINTDQIYCFVRETYVFTYLKVALLIPKSESENRDAKHTAYLQNEPYQVRWLTLLLHIWEVPGSCLGSETGYPD